MESTSDSDCNSLMHPCTLSHAAFKLFMLLPNGGKVLGSNEVWDYMETSYYQLRDGVAEVPCSKSNVPGIRLVLKK